MSPSDVEECLNASDGVGELRIFSGGLTKVFRVRLSERDDYLVGIDLTR